MKTFDEKKVFRTFLSTEDDDYVSVSAESYVNGWMNDNGVKESSAYRSCDLALSDGYHITNYSFSMTAGDEDFEKNMEIAMTKLEKIRAGVTAAMDELSDAYAELKEFKNAPVSE